MSEEARRAAVRRAVEGRCGYCGVRESEAGAELEIDHFRPRTAGGGDDLDNLVYCCTACNRHKGDFWPKAAPAMENRWLLHPGVDNLRQYWCEDSDGLLVALTKTGAYHLERLALNRPPLVALRRSRHEVARLRDDLIAAQNEQVRLRERVTALQQDLTAAVARIADFPERID